MKKTQLFPRSQHELDRWINLLLDAKAEYKIELWGKQQVLIVNEEDAINILEQEPTKPAPKWVKPVLITLAVLIGMPILGGLAALVFAPDAEPVEAFVDYSTIIDKTPNELVATFGEPSSRGELKENCPEGDCGYLDFKNGLSVNLRGGKAYRFEFNDKLEPSLARIKVDSDADPDVQNDVATHWNNVAGLEVVVTKLGDEYGYWVKKVE